MLKKWGKWKCQKPQHFVDSKELSVKVQRNALTELRLWSRLSQLYSWDGHIKANLRVIDRFFEFGLDSQH